jgi:long-chain acyl-CoA synthetase
MPAWLSERFVEAGEAPAIIWEGRSYSYAWLHRRAEDFGAELEARRVPRQSVVALEGDYSPDICALLLALIDRSAIVVPLTSAVAADRDRFLDIAGVRHTIRFRPGGQPEYGERPAGDDHPLLRRLAAAAEPGLVLFTSGSTGEPKAALHSFPRLLEKYKTRRPSLRTLTFLLLDHIGGINTLFHILSNTGVIVTVAERSPDAICAAIERHRVELLPTTPTFLNLLLLSEAPGRHDLSSLRQITYGTEPMPESTLARLLAALPGVRLSQTYGLSELGILRARSKSSDSLWVRLGGEGVETEIRDGILWIRAASAMLGYLNAASPFDSEGWFNTEDEVLADGEYFRIRGRRSEIVNVGGEKVYPAEVESVLLQIPNVRDAVVLGQPNPITGQIVVAYLNLKEPEPLDSVRRRVREGCRDLLPAFKIPARIEIVDEEQYSVRFKKNRLRRAGTG